MSFSLQNRVAIITGANQGLGLEIARKYVAAGADVMLCARNSVLLEEAKNELLKSASTNQKILVFL
jgi:NAD(P)-dependent dehydrogenase (short-subunit alcohol dehydrogenase family)